MKLPSAHASSGAQTTGGTDVEGCPPNGSDDESATHTNVKLALYAHVCQTHTAIADFRSKLLALLPIASGAGIVFLVTAGNLSGVGRGILLTVVGLSGVLVTFGLYIYDVWQTDCCRHLLTYGRRLEVELGEPHGQFGGLRPLLRPSEIFRFKHLAARESKLTEAERSAAPVQLEARPREPFAFVGAEFAGLIVYMTVLFGWLAGAIAGVVIAVQS